MAKEVAGSVKGFLESYFQKHRDDICSSGPELNIFQIKDDALLRSLWKPDWSVLERQSLSDQDGFLSKSRPCLLLYGLDAAAAADTNTNDANATNDLSQPDAHAHIVTTQPQGPSFLYGTSGAGKTRTVFEYLSRHKGFYFLADDLFRNPGSADLLSVLQDWDLKEAEPLKDTFANDVNRSRITKRISMLLFVRYAVHEMLTAHLQRDMTPYEWLLYQIFPKQLLGADLFHLAMNNCLVDEVEATMIFQHWDHRNGLREVWSIFVDEAQALLELNKQNFLSKDGTKARSAFSAVIEGFGSLSRTRQELHYPVFSGTGLSFDQFAKEAKAIVGKSLGDIYDLCFTDFKLLGVKEVRKYLGQILDLSAVSDDVQEHVANWLRGRPRWTAGFLEVYSSRKEKTATNQAWRTRGKFEGEDAKLVEALDRYLNVMTRLDDANRRETWSAGDASAYACFERVKRKLSNDPLLRQVEKDLEYTVFRFAVGQKSHPFIDAAAKILIENGVAAVFESDRQGTMIKGHLDEPIVIESGINFFGLDQHLRNHLALQEGDSYGKAFEKLLLPGLLMEKEKLHNFVKSHLGSGASTLLACDVSRRSAYGVFCVDTRGKIGETGETIEWVKNSINARFEGQVAPFCNPDDHIGPDLIFLLRNLKDFTVFVACIVQSKYVTEMDNQQDALRTLVPDKLYTEKRGEKDERPSKQLCEELSQNWNAVKDEFISDQRPCLRLLVQMPADTTSSATSGHVAAKATGPNSKSKEEKRDWLIVVDDEKAMQLFSDKSATVVRLLKRKRQTID